jgi:ATP-dependent 26S proteasome regulatory subunit
VSGERNAEIDDILNTIDGVTSKNAEIITVLTSNHAADINPAMLRPGRLDVILSIQPPDAEAAEKLMRIYGRGLIPDHASLKKSGKALAGKIPAVIRECVERAKLYVISRVGDGPFKLADEDVANAAAGMEHHLKLLAGKQPDPETPEHKLGKHFAEVMARTLVNGGNDGLYNNVKELRRYVEERV